ncbi:MAG: hypothetical protein V1892_03135 [bacterium]
MNKKLKILIIVLVIIVITGAVSWYFWRQEITLPLKPKKNILEQIQAQQETQEFVEETRLLNGKITAIDAEKNTLTVATYLPAQNPKAAQIPTERKIIITDKTVIKKIVNLPQAEGNKISFTNLITQIKIRDLKIGDLIEIIANENIKYKEEITPQEIRLLPI